MITTKVWCPKFGLDYIDLANLSDPKSIQWLNFTNNDRVIHEYILVGEADITVRSLSRDVVNGNAIVCLQAELTKVRAEAEKKSNEIKDQIQQLLAITNEV